jgi:hypothetical protein
MIVDARPQNHRKPSKRLKPRLCQGAPIVRPRPRRHHVTSRPHPTADRWIRAYLGERAIANAAATLVPVWEPVNSPVSVDGSDVGADEGCGLLINAAVAAIGVVQLKVCKGCG